MATYGTVRRRTPYGTYAERTRGGGMRLGLARLIGAAASAVAAIIVLGIALIVLEANTANAIVSFALDAARWLAGPFDGLFSLEGRKLETAVNWGIAAGVYLLVGRLIARLIAR